MYAMWAPIISGLIAWICQQTVSSPRPEGSCFKSGCVFSLFVVVVVVVLLIVIILKDVECLVVIARYVFLK